jgi:hypothetical protein
LKRASRLSLQISSRQVKSQVLLLMGLPLLMEMQPRTGSLRLLQHNQRVQMGKGVVVLVSRVKQRTRG